VRGKGHIVNISSVAAKMGTPRMTGYCASKFAMNGFSESLYHELAPVGIYVSVVCPGSVKTDFNKSFADTPLKPPSLLVITPEAVSRTVIAAIERRTFEVVIPRSLAWIFWFKSMMPGFFRAVSGRIFATRLASPKKHEI
jgi:short-subunit dehydrogenase